MAIDGGMITATAPDEVIRPTRIARCSRSPGQRRIDQPADRDHGADRGVRHRAEQFRRRDGRHRERAAHAADDRDHPGDHATRDAALRHDLAGENEIRHGQQRKIVEAAEHVGRHRDQRHVGDEHDRGERGEDENDVDRQAEDHQDRRQDEIDEIGSPSRALNDPMAAVARAGAPRGSPRRSERATIRNPISTKPIGIAACGMTRG